MKRFVVTFYDEKMGKLGRYAYYDYMISDIEISEVIEVLRRCGVISAIEVLQLSNCKCIMIEEDN